MGRYIDLLKKSNKKNPLLQILQFKEEKFFDEIYLDEDINYDEYYDDTIISDKFGVCEDFYIDDDMDYID